MFSTRLTSWESACKIIAGRRNISPLYPRPPSLALSSLFLPSLWNKFKTKVFPVHLKTILEVVLSELKIWDFHHYVQERMFFSSETFVFFETTISFSGACNISVHALAATSSEICTRQRCKKHEWLVRFSDDGKARPREISVVKRIIALQRWSYARHYFAYLKCDGELNMFMPFFKYVFKK